MDRGLMQWGAADANARVLLAACRDGKHADLAVKILDSGCSLDLNIFDPRDTQTCLMCAVRHRDPAYVPVVRRLLARMSAAQINTKALNGASALSIACHAKNEAVVAELLQCEHIDVNHVDNYGVPLLLAAMAYHDDERVAMQLLTSSRRKALDVNARALRTRETALIVAIRLNYQSIVRQLLSSDFANKLDLTLHTIKSHTALAAAVLTGNIQILDILLKDSRVDVNLTFHKRLCSPLMMAIIKRKSDVVDLFLQLRKTDLRINHCDIYGYTALMLAVVSGQSAMVASILDTFRQELHVNAYIHANDVENAGFTALWFALTSAEFDVAIVELLLNDERVDVNHRVAIHRNDEVAMGHGYTTPLANAGETCNRDAMDFLLRLDNTRLDVNYQDSKGRTALMHACHSFDLVQRLLQHPFIDATKTNHKRQTADALKKCDKRAADLIRQHAAHQIGMPTTLGDLWAARLPVLHSVPWDVWQIVIVFVCGDEDEDDSQAAIKFLFW